MEARWSKLDCGHASFVWKKAIAVEVIPAFYPMAFVLMASGHARRMRSWAMRKNLTTHLGIEAVSVKWPLVASLL